MRIIVIMAISAITVTTGSVILHARRGEVADQRSVDLESGSARSKFADVAGRRVLAHATGVVAGRTEIVSLRSEFLGRVDRVFVIPGTNVVAGDPLIGLEDARQKHRVALAKAELVRFEVAAKRLVAGSTNAEIDVVRHQVDALAAQLDGLAKRLRRTEAALLHNVSNEQTADDLRSRHQATESEWLSMQAKLKRLTDPPRDEDLRTAIADVQAARVRLAMAEEELRRRRIDAAAPATILEVNAKIGELVSPSDARPMVRMVDDRRLRVLAEVDEYDAMRLSIGLPADVYSDASRDPIATGTVSRIEPLMTRKSRYGEWAGEQVDTHVRRIWIDLSNPPELPINLPVEVSVYSGATDSPSSFNANVGKRDDANAS